MKQAVEVFIVLLSVSLAVKDTISPVIPLVKKSGNDYECN